MNTKSYIMNRNPEPKQSSNTNDSTSGVKKPLIDYSKVNKALKKLEKMLKDQQHA